MGKFDTLISEKLCDVYVMIILYKKSFIFFLCNSDFLVRVGLVVNVGNFVTHGCDGRKLGWHFYLLLGLVYLVVRLVFERVGIFTLSICFNLPQILLMSLENWF